MTVSRCPCWGERSVLPMRCSTLVLHACKGLIASVTVFWS